MNTSTNASQGKDRLPLTRADVLERFQQASVAGTQLNLANETLRGSDLSALDLGHANLNGADLYGADLSHVKIRNAQFNGANLNEARLIEADLSGADLSHAKLRSAKLMGADLSHAKLRNAQIDGADLRMARLMGADLSGADLRMARLMGADLSGADLSGANLHFASLNGANLGGARFMEADLSYANLSETDLSKAELGGAILRDVIIANPIMIGKTITLQVRLEDETFSHQHLVETIATFRSLLTKLWLLQQGRMEDFERYTQERKLPSEREVPLDIRFSVNSPANIHFNFDWSPKALVEALQQLVDTFLFWEQRRRKGELDLIAQRLQIADQELHIKEKSLELAQRLVEAVAPHLTDEQKGTAIQSVFKDIYLAAQDPTLETSLLPPQTPTPQVTVTLSSQPPQGPAQNG